MQWILRIIMYTWIRIMYTEKTALKSVLFELKLAVILPKHSWGLRQSV